jgi:hypothetical protein
MVRKCTMNFRRWQRLPRKRPRRRCQARKQPSARSRPARKCPRRFRVPIKQRKGEQNTPRRQISPLEANNRPNRPPPPGAIKQRTQHQVPAHPKHPRRFRRPIPAQTPARSRPRPQRMAPPQVPAPPPRRQAAQRRRVPIAANLPPRRLLRPPFPPTIHRNKPLNCCSIAGNGATDRKPPPCRLCTATLA